MAAKLTAEQREARDREQHTEYMRAYRAANPDRDRAAGKRWRDSDLDHSRAIQKAKRDRRSPEQRAARAAWQAGWKRRRRYQTNAQLLDLDARAVLGPRTSTLIYLLDPLYDDLLQVAAMALLEGRDAATAVREYRRVEQAFQRKTAPLLDER